MKKKIEVIIYIGLICISISIQNISRSEMNDNNALFYFLYHLSTHELHYRISIFTLCEELKAFFHETKFRNS